MFLTFSPSLHMWNSKHKLFSAEHPYCCSSVANLRHWEMTLSTHFRINSGSVLPFSPPIKPSRGSLAYVIGLIQSFSGIRNPKDRRAETQEWLLYLWLGLWWFVLKWCHWHHLNFIRPTEFWEMADRSAQLLCPLHPRPPPPKEPHFVTVVFVSSLLRH